MAVACCSFDLLLEKTSNECAAASRSYKAMQLEALQCNAGRVIVGWIVKNFEKTNFTT